MATNRLFTFNNGPAIGDALQYGNISISDYPISGYKWWPGPDEDLGYVIAHEDTNPNMRTEGSRSATVSTNSVGFWRSSSNDSDFLIMFNDLFNLGYASASNAAYWLNTNGYWTSYTPETPFSVKSFITGGFTSYNGTSVNGLIKLNTDGTIDNTFSVGTGFSQSSNYDFNSHTVLIQSDEKILVGGNFTSYNGTSRNNIIRLNGDGSIDSGFTIGTGFNGLLLKIKTQTDGKIIAVGGFTLYNGVSSREIIRLNGDGSVDNTFSVGTGFNSSLVYDVEIQSNGKIIACGVFTEYDGTSSPGIARLNSNGTIDNGFIVGTGFNNNVFSLAIQSDGKILVGGQFTLYNSTTCNGIVRLNSDGSIDSTFSAGSGLSDVRSIKIQYDGKIIAVGGFTSYNGTSINRIIRLNVDGSIDNGFAIGSGFNFSPYDLKIQADGKIIVIGNFTSYNGTSCNGIIRLNTDGSIDSGFTIGSGFNFTIGFSPSGID
jgi:uncharacterized delta-60 repeat protein